MDEDLPYIPTEELHELSATIDVLVRGREEVLKDWMERVRDNRAVEAGETLTDPLLLDHIPQLFDAIVERLSENRSRAEAEQAAAVHGFTRRITGYDVVETVIELLMFRRAIWAHLTATDAEPAGACAAMERIDGMVDRAVISSLEAYLDPGARLLERRPLDRTE
jgi:hypothetical protein